MVERLIAAQPGLHLPMVSLRICLFMVSSIGRAEAVEGGFGEGGGPGLGVYSYQNASGGDFSKEKLLLLPLAMGFLVNAFWSGFEVYRHRRMVKNTLLVTSSSGWQMRERFHLMLFGSNLVRLLALVVEMCLHVPGVGTEENVRWWYLGMIHGVPDLLFLSTFGLLIVFYAQLYYATYGITLRSLKPLFMLSNIIVYIVFATIAAVTYVGGTFAALREYSMILLTLAYFVSLLGIIYYGYNVTIQLTPQADYNFPARSMILRRIATLCILFGCVFFVHFVHGVLSLVLLKPEYMGYPPHVNRYVFDCLQYASLEFLPSLITLFLTAKKRAPSADSDIEEMPFGSEGSPELSPLLQ